VSDAPDLLYVVHRTPFPPDKGDRIRAYHVLRHLAGRARVHLACLADEPVPEADRRALEGLCARLAVVPVGGPGRWLRAAAAVALGGTASVAAFRSRALRAVLRGWARQTRFAAALASASSVAPYLARAVPDVPAVVDLVDVDSQKWHDYAAAARGVRAWLYRTEGRRLRRLECRLAARCRAVTLVSEAEADLFRRACPGAEAHVVTNGVDLDYFRPYSPALAEEGCVFVGALDYRPNVDGVCWFVREVWPEVRRRRPEARLRLVGRRPAAEARALGGVPGVDVVGQVPDVRPHLAWAAVAVAPLRIARGLQNKVLEALAMRKAVVASPPALAGLTERLDLPALTASSPAEWAGHLDRLLGDEGLRRQLGAAGRRYVEAHHSWGRCLAPLGTLLGLPDRPPAAADAARAAGPSGTLA
jgi:sugar transferase (PEP-CTERM/EpsH1 system associated)